MQHRSPMAPEPAVKSMSQSAPDFGVEVFPMGRAHGDVAGERIEQVQMFLAEHQPAFGTRDMSPHNAKRPS